ncbi:dihydroxyacetone kinase phosphoryl donor subunit DhaM [Actinophytocola algeriensis]|uniref:Phosphocarrier protein HPr n=1 Tax=Actinophytocola algeriensis TaxID=1768010 RepID=A0A7W7Q5U5_9PSEU|nr:dihydroxyacetone kinase phosphoryl donor subunit DhaM [Actinophytocola algeriensis]MBB4907524.1 PTS hybrid protein [Actinophytocola algeriensis]MBE1479554.1 PTS hybrid protein [Actinophytocola algeriensis]
MSRVGLVVVSHSAGLAAGVVEVAAQMAPDVIVVPAGGTADGGIGTDFDAVAAALDRAESGAGVVLLYDLGSARMVAEMAVEVTEGARLVDAPLVEGTVAAAVAAQGGADLDDVAHAALEAVEVPGGPVVAEGVAGGVDIIGSQSIAAAQPTAPAEVVVPLTNEIGLHARPAAMVARAMTQLDARVTVRYGDATADGRSVLALMALGARGGDEVHVSATGPQADEALQTFQDLAARDFDE